MSVLISSLLVLGAFSVTTSEACTVFACCDYQKYMDDPSTTNPSCQDVRNYCAQNPKGDCDDDDVYLDFNLETTEISLSSQQNNNSLSGSEYGLIAVGAILVVAVIAAIGVASHRYHAAVTDEPKSNSIELSENLVEDHEEHSPRRGPPSGVLTIMATVSCIVAVVALIIAIVAVTDTPVAGSASPTASSSSGSNLQAMAQNSAQLRTGHYKLSASSMIASHPWCHQSMDCWKSCAMLDQDLQHIIQTVGNNQLNVTQTMERVTKGVTGDRVFVAQDSKFLAAAPLLSGLQSKLNQTHLLASTTVCSTWSSFSHKVCVATHMSIESNASVLIAYIQPTADTADTGLKTRRSTSSSALTLKSLSANWHGTASGVLSSIEQGTEHNAWKGAIAGAISGATNGGVAGAIEGALVGAVKGGVKGGLRAGVHYVDNQAIGDVQDTEAGK